MWFGGAGLTLGIFMQYWQSRKKDDKRDEQE
jgi:hypothetical protein